MKFVAIPILILLLMGQTFDKGVMLISFMINRDYIAKKLCENRLRPKLHCNGKCILMKKMQQQEKKENDNAAALKIESGSTVISSRSFFANNVQVVTSSLISYPVPHDDGRPVDRTLVFFHPPSL